MESKYNADCNMQTFTLSLHLVQRTEVRFEQYKYINNIAADEPELLYVSRTYTETSGSNLAVPTL